MEICGENGQLCAVSIVAGYKEVTRPLQVPQIETHARTNSIQVKRNLNTHTYTHTLSHTHFCTHHRKTGNDMVERKFR